MFWLVQKLFHPIKKMNTVIKLTLLLSLFILYVASTPVSCNSGSTNMGSILETETLGKPKKSTPATPATPPPPPAPTGTNPCEDKDVCKLHCSFIYPTCTKTAYFIDFMNYAVGTDKTIQNSYIGVCIKRKNSKDVDNSWINLEIYKLAIPGNEYQQKKLAQQIDRVRKLLDNFVASGIPSQIYLASMFEVLFTFQKLCTSSPSENQKFPFNFF
jgi:hypothetical protein